MLHAHQALSDGHYEAEQPPTPRYCVQRSHTNLSRNDSQLHCKSGTRSMIALQVIVQLHNCCVNHPQRTNGSEEACVGSSASQIQCQRILKAVYRLPYHPRPNRREKAFRSYLQEIVPRHCSYLQGSYENAGSTPTILRSTSAQQPFQIRLATPLQVDDASPPGSASDGH